MLTKCCNDLAQCLEFPVQYLSYYNSGVKSGKFTFGGNEYVAHLYAAWRLQRCKWCTWVGIRSLLGFGMKLALPFFVFFLCVCFVFVHDANPVHALVYVLFQVLQVV